MKSFLTCRKGSSRRLAVGRAAIEVLEERRLLSTIYVDASSLGPTRDGTTWGNAYADLQLALGAAVPGDTIRVADGTYKPTSGTNVTISFQLRTGVGVYGGYAGNGAADPNMRNLTTFPTILSGDIGISGDNSDNSCHVISCDGADPTTLLDGLTISDGNAYETDYQSQSGAGLYIASGSPTISNCVFSNNSAASHGGGLYAGDGSPAVSNCTFKNNTAAYGGGVYNYYSSPTFADCAFIENTANGYDGYGGGLYNWSSSLTLTNCTFIRNKSSAGSGAGMASASISSAQLANCTFNGNVAASYSGGAIHSDNSTLVMANCVLSGNAAPYGGGITAVSSSMVSLTNCTLANNTAGADGAISESASSVSLSNCVLWGNSPLTNFLLPTNPVTATYSDVQGGIAGAGNINTNPWLVRAPGPGSDGLWGTPDDDYGDLRLSPISPCDDAGNNAAVPSGLNTDIAGGPRFLDIPTTPDTGAGATPVVDMGAFETAPVVAAGTDGPYMVTQGRSLTLHGLGAGSVAGQLQFAWEWTGDGKFDDATGASPVFDATGRLPGIITVDVRVTDAASQTAMATTSLKILSAVFYVDLIAAGANDGSSWTNAFTSLSAALTATVGAVPGQEIHVAHGTHIPTTSTDRTATFRLNNGVSILGSYAGLGAPDPEARSLSLYTTILSGRLAGAVQSYHVVDGSNTDASAVLDGCRITDGNASASGSQAAGGGMYISSGSPTIRNCTFAGNSAALDGGGMAIIGGSPTVINCVFVGNSAPNGAGVNNTASSVTLINCTLAETSNSCIYNSSSAPTIRNCIIWSPTKESITQYNSTPTVTYSLIRTGFTGTGTINADPQYIRNPSGSDLGDLRLRITSPAIDAGNNAAIPAGITTDVAGTSRFVDVAAVADTGAGTAPITDMGAYEAFGTAAGAAGPYDTIQGQMVTLDGYGGSTIPGGVQYAWEWSGDGKFDDAAIAKPTINTTGWAPGKYTVSLRVTDAASGSASATAMLLVRPAILYVDSRATGTDNTGASWNNAMQDLQSALGVVIAGQSIHVAQGTYRPTTFMTGRSASFQLKNGVSLLGGYAGVGAASPDTRDTVNTQSILSGDIGTSGYSDDNSYHVVNGNSVDSTAIFDGFTITAGNANGSFPDYRGGGMIINSGSPTVRNCTFISNNASQGGGMGIYSGARPTVAGCSFISNSGGGFYTQNSTPSLTDCVFTQNAGGGVYNSGGTPTIDRCVFRGNAATLGGGVYNDYTSLKITNSVFIANSASDSGGGVYNPYTYVNTNALYNCVFIGNSAVKGGAVFGDEDVYNCTFAANSATTGGAINNPGSSTLTITNCILWGNTAAISPQVNQGSGTPTVTYCDIQGGFTGTGNINADPLFVRNPSSGADGKWGTIDDDLGDVRVTAASTVVDAGNNSITGMPSVDLAGNARRIDIYAITDTGSGSAPVIDMGAYEAVPALVASAGAPYAVAQGHTISLSGRGASDVNGPVTFAWEWSGDGLFDDATGPNPIFSAVGREPGLISISLRVTDAASRTTVNTTTLTVASNVIYVDDSATGANDGTSWTNAYTTLTAALNAAFAGVPGQEIQVAQGTYKPTTGTDRAATFQIKNQVSVIGGYAGDGAVDPNALNPTLYRSVLSGDIGVAGTNTDNCYHVVTASGTDSLTRFDGFTIVGGNANGTSPYDSGGGFYSQAGNLNISDCIFNGNLASKGGAAYASTSSSTWTNCVYSGNSATSGAAIYVTGGVSQFLVNCTIADGAGSGIYCDATAPTIYNCIIWTPSASAIGGSTTPAVTYSIVRGGSSNLGNLDADPIFARNPGPGADGKWGTGDDDYGDLRILPVSPAVDAGTNSALRLPTLDITGSARRVDIPTIADTGVGTAPIIDMGAYEAVPALAAWAGGPYRVALGKSLTFTGRGASDVAGSLQMDWEWTGDGKFNDGTGPNPVFSAAGLPLGLVTVSMRMTDAASQSVTVTTTVKVERSILYVDASAKGSNDGTTWTNAFTTVTAALAAGGASGQEIRVAHGTYKPATTTDRTATFQLKNGVSLCGGYAGIGAANPDGRDVVGNASILSGDIGVAGDNTDNSYHVVTGSGTDVTAVLDGFSIVAGNANGTGSSKDSGGGMINFYGNPTITNCSFSGNSASYVGGAISNDYSSPTVTNCTFMRNTAASSGGGMSNYHTSSPTLTNCVFAGNSAGTSGGAGWGGGINNTYVASPTLINCLFVGNSSTSVGGGMWTDAMTTSPPQASPTVINCTFVANSAAIGGALANSRDLLTLTNSILWGNSAPNGSQLYQDGGTANVSHSDIQGGYSGTHIINTDPLFTRSPNPGADGKWGTIDDDYGNLRLRLNSPAIDAGKNGAVPTGVTTDHAGNSRFLDIPTIPNTGLGTSPLVDMGAFESSPADTGGPYVVNLLQNTSITLNGSGVSGVPGALSYAWEWTGDGKFDDATGPNPVFNAAGMPGSTRTIALRVTDAAQNSVVSTTILTIIAPIYVDTRATGANDGTSWTNAFKDLNTALGQAITGQGIAVAAGTYKPTTTTDRNATFQLKNGVGVFGGYAGYGAANPDARDCVLYPSILSGDIGTFNLSTDNSYHVVTGSGTNASAIFDGFTITGGNANDSGAGMYNSAGSPTVNNCIFKSNTASFGGGGMYNFSGSAPAISNCTFTGNTAPSYGGGIYNYSNSSPTLTNCSFIGNSASQNSGGGMYSALITTAITLTNCTFIRNTAQRGGGMFNNCEVKLINCNFSGNTALDSGGGINNSSYLQTLTNCVFSGNSATQSGGAMYNNSSTTLINCTFGGNSAPYGGGIYNVSSTTNATNCIIWGSGSAPMFSNGGTQAIVYSDIQGNYNGTGNIATDPQFVRSPWAGTDGVFGTADDDYGDLRLRAGSPALDIGSNAALPAGTATDVAGNARIQNITVDMGAYEGAVTASVPGLKTIYVDRSAAGANSGTSWTDAFVSLQSALVAAVDGDTIRIADGTYKPSTATDRTSSFCLKNAVAIYGGYAGYGATNPDARDIVANRTVLSGDIGVAGTNSDNSYHVVTAMGGSSVLDGVTITLGNANGVATNQNAGGGLNAISSLLMLSNCAISGNLASASGGGMYNANSSPKVTNCTFTGNSSASTGGGMYNILSSSPTLTNCTFSGNSASSNGSGMYNTNFSSPTLINCIIWGSGGSVIYNSSGTLTVTCSDIQGGYTGTGNINSDPLFVRNPSVGADGKWGTADDDYGDLHLQFASPCIDAGSNAAVPAGTATDLEGNSRIIDIPGVRDPGAIVDMGAYERTLQSINIAGTPDNDAYYLRFSAGKASLELFTGNSAQGTPTVYPAYSACKFDTGGGNDTLTLDFTNGAPNGTFVAGGGGDMLILTGMTPSNNVSIAPASIAADTASISAPDVEAVTLDAAAGSTIGLASLSVSIPVSLVAGKNLVLRTGSLNITGSGSLDLAGNSMILDYSSSPLTQVRKWISNGRMGITPALKTSGAVSSGTAALGMVDNALVQLTSFEGRSLGGVFSQLLIKPTVAGDTNLDGAVSSADYLAVVANMGKTNSQWFMGDLNCDGSVTVDDLAEVTSHMGDRVVAAPAAMAVTTGPQSVAAKAKAPVKAKTVVKAKNGRSKRACVPKLKL